MKTVTLNNNGVEIATFMISGPTTKITNLSALKVAFSAKRFLVYLGYVILPAIASGVLVETVLK